MIEKQIYGTSSFLDTMPPFRYPKDAPQNGGRDSFANSLRKDAKNPNSGKTGVSEKDNKTAVETPTKIQPLTRIKPLTGI